MLPVPSTVPRAVLPEPSPSPRALIVIGAGSPCPSTSMSGNSLPLIVAVPPEMWIGKAGTSVQSSSPASRPTSMLSPFIVIQRREVKESVHCFPPALWEGSGVPPSSGASVGGKKSGMPSSPEQPAQKRMSGMRAARRMSFLERRCAIGCEPLSVTVRKSCVISSAAKRACRRLPRQYAVLRNGASYF